MKYVCVTYVVYMLLLYIGWVSKRSLCRIHDVLGSITSTRNIINVFYLLFGVCTWRPIFLSLVFCLCVQEPQSNQAESQVQRILPFLLCTSVYTICSISGWSTNTLFFKSVVMRRGRCHCEHFLQTKLSVISRSWDLLSFGVEHTLCPFSSSTKYRLISKGSYACLRLSVPNTCLQIYGLLQWPFTK